MRPYEQRQILETVQTLREVVKEFEKQNDTNVVLGLASECAEFANAISNHIDALVGGKTDTSMLLDEFAVLLDKYISEEIKEGKLRNQIGRIEKSIKSELKPDKIEMVFLSYNASMSDSLYSIYMEAKNDPSCDAYWIPIPYYQIEPDGSLGAEHFEPYGLDDGMEYTDWRKYDMEARHPEVIFTFNGYDEYNAVTRVHPNFYCSRLKDFTDCLVYVPYFVVDSDAKPEMYEHFANLPGTWYADKVMLQDEKVRNTYLDVFTNKYGRQFGNPKDKFVALGSAKYDKAINSRREDYDLPNGWKEAIGNKKVVFYNTSIGAMLNNTESYLEKMSVVFNQFRKRDDIVLWWRPHPLFMETFSSMRPEYYDQYKKIVEEFRDEEWGIYDDSTDLHRAIAWADVYYGDGSSLTELFEVKDKPVYYQHIGFYGGSDRLLGNLYFYVTDLFKVDNRLYAVTFSEHLFEVTKGGLQFVREIPTSAHLPRHRNYSSRIPSDSNIFFIPHVDEKLLVLSKETNEYSSYSLELDSKLMDQQGDLAKNFYTGILYKNKIILIPFKYGQITEFNLETKKTKHCLDVSKLRTENETGMFRSRWQWLKDNTILLVCIKTNEILEYNLDSSVSVFYKPGGGSHTFQGIFKYENDFFLICDQTKIMKWNYETGNTKIYSDLPKGFEVIKKQDWAFYVYNIDSYKNKLILMGGFTNMVIEFDMEKCEFRKIGSFDKLIDADVRYDDNKDLSFATGAMTEENNLYFINKNETLYRYDFETEDITMICSLEAIFTDKDIKTLNENFIENMLNSEYAAIKANPGELQDGQAGNRIYNNIKKKVLKQ